RGGTRPRAVRPARTRCASTSRPGHRPGGTTAAEPRGRHAMELNGWLANTADGVCAVGTDGKIVLWNRAAEKILGHTPREVLGRSCCEVFVGWDAAGNRLCYQGCHVMTLVRQGEPVQHFQMATRTKLGKPVWLDISILTVPGRSHDPPTPTTPPLRHRT